MSSTFPLNRRRFPLNLPNFSSRTNLDSSGVSSRLDDYVDNLLHTKYDYGSGLSSYGPYASDVIRPHSATGGYESTLETERFQKDRVGVCPVACGRWSKVVHFRT